jgi:regulator of protease activity HflC (stomatin/prohibitin superfamily)
MAASWQQIRLWQTRHRNLLIGWTLVATLLILLLWPHMVVTIESGHAGVLYSRFFGGTVLDKVYREGLRLILPWDTMIIYDTRLKEEVLKIDLVSKDGLRVVVDASVRYYPLSKRLPQLHQQIGPDYREKLVVPIITATVQDVLGDYRPEQIYTGSAQKIQDEIMAQAVEAMGRKPIIIDNLLLTHVTLPDKINEAIMAKLVAEQELLRYQYHLLIAREEFKKRYIEAESQRMYEDKVAPGLTDNYLRWTSIEAIRDLAKSPNSKFVVMGGKDGIPLILNPEGSPVADPKASGAPRPAASPAPAPAPAAKPAPEAKEKAPAPTPESSTNWEEILKRFNDIVIPQIPRDQPPPTPPLSGRPDQPGKESSK